jgi:CRISPR-associated exonuclease Cas4
VIPKQDASYSDAGDRDYKQVVRDAIESLGEDVGIKIDPSDFQTIHLHEVAKCMRQSYYDRVDPLAQEQSSLNKILGGLFRKLKSHATIGNYEFDGIKLKGQADMIVRDVVMIFRSVDDFPENPLPSDILYLNACMWMFDKIEGIITYITRDGKEDSFVSNRNQKMFEEIVRRTKVYHDLLNEKKKPIIEPSIECLKCQYYSRCFIKRKEGKPISIPSLFGTREK